MKDSMIDDPPSGVSTTVDQTTLDGGGLKLSMHGGEQFGVLSAIPSEERLREAARIITMAWGDRYVTGLLDAMELHDFWPEELLS